MRALFRLWAATLFTSAALFGTAQADKTLTFTGNAPDGGPDHFFIPFEVPAGVAEIEVSHQSTTPDNILDFGINDAQGYRGWGGGTTENAIIGERAASRAYVPGPLLPGTYSVVVGKAKILHSPAGYHVEVTLRDAPTLMPQTERRPYVPVPALRKGRRYYAGDLHVHSLESTDARPTLDEIVRFASGRGLDFVEISDHNTVTQMDFFGAAQAQSKDLLLLPGIEVTTYAGHMNAIGATHFVEHKIGQPGVTIDTTAAAIFAQGALLSINHPVLDLGDTCIGCAWKQPLDGAKVNGVEVGSGGLDEGGLFFLSKALAFWEALLAQGHHVAALGGSDDHRGGQGSGTGQSPIGDPTTLVLADELSFAAIVDGIAHGRTVVKLAGPDDPMVEFSAGSALPGDTLHTKSVLLTAKVTGAQRPNFSATVRFVKNGNAQDEKIIDKDPFIHTQSFAAPESGEDHYRVEVLVDNLPRTVASPIYVQRDLSPQSEMMDDNKESGCQHFPSRESAARRPFIWLLTGSYLALLGLGWARSTRRKRTS